MRAAPCGFRDEAERAAVRLAGGGGGRGFRRLAQQCRGGPPSQQPCALARRSFVLTGPRKSGRSLLGRIFVLRTGGTLIENGERIDETDLFHAWNGAQETRRPLLITADHWPADWTITLPDLRSRLMATPHVTLGDPDDELIRQLLQRLLERRGNRAARRCRQLPRAARAAQPCRHRSSGRCTRCDGAERAPRADGAIRAAGLRLWETAGHSAKAGIVGFDTKMRPSRE